MRRVPTRHQRTETLEELFQAEYTGTGWGIIEGTGDFVGLTGSGPYIGREILQDPESFGNPIYIFEPVSAYSDKMTGTIEFG